MYMQTLALTRVCSAVLDPLRPHGLWFIRLLCPWDSPGKITGAGCYFLLQGIFPIQESVLEKQLGLYLSLYQQL